MKKTESRQVDINEQRELLKKIENTTQDQTELILSQELNLPLIVEAREKIHRDESVTITMTFSKEQMALLEQAQGLISHSVPGGQWTDVMMYLAQKEIVRRTQIKRQSKSSSEVSKSKFETHFEKQITTALSPPKNRNCPYKI